MPSSKSPPAPIQQQPKPSSYLLKDDDDEFVRTKILLLGLRRSGKTSITQVLFNGLAPKQSFFIEPSIKLTKLKVDSFTPLEIWDAPGNVTPETLGVPLSIFTSIIFVIDIQDNYNIPIARCLDWFIQAFQEKPSINLEVFVHKAEALSEEFRNESYRHVQGRIDDELADIPPIIVRIPGPSQGPNRVSAETTVDPQDLPIIYHLTSVYDHSINEAFSRVLNRILAPGCLPFIEDLLNAFCGASHSSKAFLFDTVARVYIATDHSPVDSATHNICCDFVHMLNRFGGLYKSATTSPSKHPRRTGIEPAPAHRSSSTTPLSNSPTTSLPSSPRSNAAQTPKSQSTSAAASRAPTPTHTATSPTVSQILSSKGGPDLDTPSKVAGAGSSLGSGTGNGTGVEGNGKDASPGETKSPKELFFPSASVTLQPYTTLVYYAVTPRLALVALLPTDVWETKRGLVEFNVVFFREGVQEVYDVEQDSHRRKKVSTPTASRK